MSKWILPAITALSLFCGNLAAQDGSNHPIFTNDWLFKVGGQRSDADAKIGLANSDLGEIPIIDIGDGDANTTVNSFGGNIIWQAPDRWSFGLSYFQARVEGERLSSEDFTFGDLLIPAGTGIRTDFETDFYVLNGYYDFYQAPGSSAGIGLGIYAMDLSIGAELVVGGQPTGQAEGADTLAPLPTISAYYKHAFSDRWALAMSAGFFAAEIDKYDGEVFTADVSVQYWPSDNLGFGLGYTFVDVDLTIDEPVFDQKYVVEYDSFFVYATFGF